MEELQTLSVTVNSLDGKYRDHIKLWSEVAIVTKKDQKTGIYTYGKVRWILTSKPFHSRGIKVMLENRKVGRVQKIILTDKMNKEEANG